MKRMRMPLFGWLRQQRSSGYTIIEVLIFFAVTGVLLVSALAIFRGQQGRTQFTQAVRETDQQLRTIINEVGSGQYTKKENFTCVAAGQTAAPTFNSSSSEQGTNTGCIFLGKVIQFGPSVPGQCTAPSLSNCTQYNIFTLMGRRQYNGQDVARLSAAKPRAVPNLTENFTLPGGLRVTAMKWQLNNGSTYYNSSAFALVYSLAASNPSGDPVSRTTRVDAIPLYGGVLVGAYPFPLGKTTTDVNNAIEVFHNAGLGGTDANIRSRTTAITICFDQGPGSRKAAIRIGGNGQELSTNTFIDNVPGECAT